MTSIFLYEHLCASSDPSLPESWRIEGRAMRDALAEDFRRLPDIELILANSDDEAEFRRNAGRADWSLVIVPETDGELHRRSEWVVKAGGRLLSPSPEIARICSDKSDEDGRPFHADMPAIDPDDYPQIWKPRFGAGSQDIFFVPDRSIAQMLVDNGFGRLIRTEYVEGIHASVAFLCGPNRIVALPPCWQLLSDDGRFRYLGGEVPILPHLAERVVAVAKPAIACLQRDNPFSVGYLGVDVVLGDDRDVLIEINPRMTTSYIGLRQLCETNLAEAMLKIARGNECELRWKADRVRFRPDGRHEY